MSVELTAAVGFVAAAAATSGLTPGAIAVARRTGFYDHPRGYRKHVAPTPFLGGAAVLAGSLIAALAVGGTGGKHLFLACAVALWLLGTLDDRVAVPPRWRLLADALAAIALVSAGLGWHTTGGDGVDFVLSVLWVVGLVNAFNLMDNMDGACGTVGGVSALGIGTLAAIHGQVALAGLAFGLAGACAGFLPWNLSRPAKIFLGDGGSMPIGFLVAGLTMATCRHLQIQDANLLAGGLLVGIPILDTGLVTVSRLRRGVPVVTGGRDHLTHRLLLALHSPRAVAATLAALQATLCTLAIVGDQLGAATVAAFAFSVATLGALAIAVLDSSRWRPTDIAVAARAQRAAAAGIDST